MVSVEVPWRGAPVAMGCWPESVNAWSMFPDAQWWGLMELIGDRRRIY